MRHVCCVLLIALLMWGCDPDSDADDGGVAGAGGAGAAGGAAGGGGSADADVSSDAEVQPDAMVDADAGLEPDAARVPDAEVQPDAEGLPDAGPPGTPRLVRSRMTWSSGPAGRGTQVMRFEGDGIHVKGRLGR
ncbi:MAG: hypothetical protein ACE366_26950 [Bradymonadia bacterium]